MRTMVKLTMMVMVLALALPAQAGGRGGGKGRGKGRGGPPTAEQMEKMKTFRAKALREKVGLDEATATKVEATMDSFQERRRELHETMRESMKSLKALLKEDSNDQEAFANALEVLKAGHDEMRSLQEEQMQAVRKLLTPKQQAKLLVTMRQFKHKAGRFMSGKRGGGGGMGPPDDMGPPDFDGGF